MALVSSNIVEGKRIRNQAVSKTQNIDSFAAKPKASKKQEPYTRIKTEQSSQKKESVPYASIPNVGSVQSKRRRQSEASSLAEKVVQSPSVKEKSSGRYSSSSAVVEQVIAPELEINTKELSTVFDETKQPPGGFMTFFSGLFSSAANEVTGAVESEFASGNISQQAAVDAEKQAFSKIEQQVEKAEVETILKNVARLSAKNTEEQTEVQEMIEDLKDEIARLRELLFQKEQQIERQVSMLSPLQQEVHESDRKSRKSLSKLDGANLDLEKLRRRHADLESQFDLAVNKIVERDNQLSELKKEAEMLRATVSMTQEKIVDMTDDDYQYMLETLAADEANIAAARQQLLQLQPLVRNSARAEQQYLELKDAIEKTLIESANDIIALKSVYRTEIERKATYESGIAQKLKEATDNAARNELELERLKRQLRGDLPAVAELDAELQRVRMELENLRQSHAISMIEATQSKAINSILETTDALLTMGAPIRNKPRTYGGQDAVNVNRDRGYKWMKPILLRDQGMSAYFANYLLNLVGSRKV